MPNGTCQLLGEKIRQSRKARHITQQQLSAGIVTRNMLSRIENGMADPSLSTLIAIAARLECSVGYLLDDSDDGHALRDKELTELIAEEYRDGDDIRLFRYAADLCNPDAAVTMLVASAGLRLGKKLMAEGDASRSGYYLGRVLVFCEKSPVPFACESEARTLIVMNDIFSTFTETEDIMPFFDTLLENGKGDNDILKLARFNKALESLGEGAECALSLLSFDDLHYDALCRGILFLQSQQPKKACRYLLEALTDETVLPIAAMILLFLRKAEEARGNLDRAYNYDKRRRSLEKSYRKSKAVPYRSRQANE